MMELNEWIIIGVKLNCDKILTAILICCCLMCQKRQKKKPTFSLGNKVTLKLCNYFFSLSIDKKQIHKHTYRQRHRDIETYRHTDIQTYRHVNNNIQPLFTQEQTFILYNIIYHFISLKKILFSSQTLRYQIFKYLFWL